MGEDEGCGYRAGEDLQSSLVERIPDPPTEDSRAPATWNAYGYPPLVSFARCMWPKRWRLTLTIDDLWYKNGVFYCLSVATFMDANGDGIGDFTGLLRRLDYLHGLGITAIWLMPFQPSPSRDDGYDITDYYGVDPRYGTLGDFVEFTQGCQQRGIRVSNRSRRQPQLRSAPLVSIGA